MIGPLWLGLYQKLKRAIKRQEVYTGVTDALGDYTVSFSTPYHSVPEILPKIIPQTDPNQQCRVTSASTSGFTVHVESRSSISVLGVGVALGFNTASVSGAPVKVFVMEA